MILKNNRGDIFLDFEQGDEVDLLNNEAFRPLTHALVIIRDNNQYLFIFNHWKQRWELPGGIIEAGETAREGAIRELFEETGYSASDLRFRGLMKFCLQPDERIEYGALYIGKLDTRVTFIPNNEAEQIIFWDMEADIGIVDEIDRKLVDFFEWKVG